MNRPDIDGIKQRIDRGIVTLEDACELIIYIIHLEDRLQAIIVLASNGTPQNISDV